MTNSTGPTIGTQLSTNDVYAGMLDQSANGQAELGALHAPLIRIHAGDDGTSPAAMPEVQQGQWDFSSLDDLVGNVFASGQRPLMNIKFAPDWMWTCTSFGAPGEVRDQTFQTFARYMARVVSYYNKGHMTTESGQVISNPAGTSHAITYWELWNEPDLDNETPCTPPSGQALTPSQYVTMWNAVTMAMLAVDPTVKFVGPATAGSQFGSSTTTGNQYVDELMAHGAVKPAAISFHGYGYWDNSVPDSTIFDGDHSQSSPRCCGGITDMINGVEDVHSQYPTVPVWLTEVNINAAWGEDPANRPSSEFAAAWWGSMFVDLAPLNVGVIHQYDLVDGPQFGLINYGDGNPFIAYYVFKLLDQAFPRGSTLLQSSSSDPGILTLAAKKPDGTTSLLVVNGKLASNTVVSPCGQGGVPVTVTLSLPLQPSSVRETKIDKSNVNCSSDAGIAPSAETLAPAQSETVSLPGYGLAVLSAR